MKEYLVYALIGDDQRYQERLISESNQTKTQVEDAIKRAQAQGWHSFRIAEFNGEAPNFMNTLNTEETAIQKIEALGVSRGDAQAIFEAKQLMKQRRAERKINQSKEIV
jgi:hypothetical protein